MRVTVSLRVGSVEPPDEFCTSAAISEVARAAERVGFDAVMVTDHPVPHDDQVVHGGHQALDPFVALACAAAATTTLRLLTYVLVVPFRNPFLSAKAISSLDVVSDGRVIVGVGAGYMRSEAAALGVAWDERNQLLDEGLAAMKLAWTGEPFTFTGLHAAADGNRMLPRPVQHPHPPIWVGGNTRRAIRRAVEAAQGWIPFPNRASDAASRASPALETMEQLTTGIAYAREHATAIGRAEPLEIPFFPNGFEFWTGRALSTQEIVDTAGALGEAGVTSLLASVGGATRAEYIDGLERYGSEVLPHLAAL